MRACLIGHRAVRGEEAVALLVEAAGSPMGYGRVPRSSARLRHVGRSRPSLKREPAPHGAVPSHVRARACTRWDGRTARSSARLRHVGRSHRSFKRAPCATWDDCVSRESASPSHSKGHPLPARGLSDGPHSQVGHTRDGCLLRLIARRRLSDDLQPRRQSARRLSESSFALNVKRRACHARRGPSSGPRAGQS